MKILRIRVTAVFQAVDLLSRLLRTDKKTCESSL